MPFRRLVPGILLALLTAFLVVATLGSIGQPLVGDEAPLGVLSLGQWGLAETWTRGTGFEFVANVIAFVPWGVLALILLGERRWWLAAVLGTALTLAIEIAQIPLERISDPRDLVANASGVLIGIAGAVIARRLRAARATEPEPLAEPVDANRPG